jgi:hypothetical protein
VRWRSTGPDRTRLRRGPSSTLALISCGHGVVQNCPITYTIMRSL